MYSIYGAIEKLLSCRPKTVNMLFKLSEEGVHGRFGHLGRHFLLFALKNNRAIVVFYIKGLSFAIVDSIWTV